jgi:hypothetical protein
MIRRPIGQTEIPPTCRRAPRRRGGGPIHPNNPTPRKPRHPQYQTQRAQVPTTATPTRHKHHNHPCRPRNSNSRNHITRPDDTSPTIRRLKRSKIQFIRRRGGGHIDDLSPTERRLKSSTIQNSAEKLEMSSKSGLWRRSWSAKVC